MQLVRLGLQFAVGVVDCARTPGTRSIPSAMDIRPISKKNFGHLTFSIKCMPIKVKLQRIYRWSFTQLKTEPS